MPLLLFSTILIETLNLKNDKWFRYPVKDRRALAVYPMVLFYFIISWLVITYTG